MGNLLLAHYAVTPLLISHVSAVAAAFLLFTVRRSLFLRSASFPSSFDSSPDPQAAFP
jgi:hypothetical protein